MATAIRKSVDLSGTPNLVVIYLGMRVTALTGLKTLFGFGPAIAKAAAAKPDGLLNHEFFLFSLTHVGMRQYWRDMESLEAFSHSEPHKTWWREFLRETGGTGFWHETYCLKGGMEAVYISMPAPLGFGTFAPPRDPVGPFMTARGRL
jgi:hypothetical protein